MSKDKILVLGSAGFICSNLCHWLINNTEYEVIGVDNLSGGFIENMPQLSERFSFFNTNINSESLNHIFEAFKPFVCYHLAAYASEGRSNHIRRFIHQNNTVGSANVINCCVNHNCKLIFTSSVAVYSGTPPFNEFTIPDPIDEYGLSKLTTEKSIQIAGEVSGLKWVIIRPRNVYGERQSLLDPSRNLFGIWMYNALKGIECQIYGDGTNIRNFTYINDILQPLWCANGCKNKIINLGSKNFFTIYQVAEVFTEVTGYDNFMNVEARHEVGEAFCDIDKSQNWIGFKDKTSLREGLTKMWEWAKKQQLGERQIPPSLEITKNVHTSLL